MLQLTLHIYLESLYNIISIMVSLLINQVAIEVMLMKLDIIVFYKQSKKSVVLTLTVKCNQVQIFHSNPFKPIRTQLQSRLSS